MAENEQQGRVCELCGRHEPNLSVTHGVDGDHYLCAEDQRNLDGVATAAERWLNWPDTVTRERALDLLRTRLEPVGIDVADRLQG